MSDEEEDYFLPLEDQRVFGAGVKRKRIAFVPSSTPSTTVPAPKPARSSQERYLSIVSKKPSKELLETGADATSTLTEEICPICNLPLPLSVPSTHESSIAHQLCLAHSHPPSHLDRAHVGVKYLSNYGWDPDARLGLGAAGDGIRAPIKGKVKNDTSGLGVDRKDTTQKQKGSERYRPGRLNAKQVRQQEADGKKRAAQLRDAFYGKDLEQYLGAV